MSNAIAADYMDEPLLSFADGGLHVDPKEGISRYGPRSFSPRDRHPQVVRLGFIGTAETAKRAEVWLQTTSLGARGDGPHLTFPGFAADRGFFSALDFSSSRRHTISKKELSILKKIAGEQATFEATLGLLDEKLALLAEADEPVDYVVVALPTSMVRSAGVVRYSEPGRGIVVRNLRRAFKARAMRYRIPTQVVLTDTTSLSVRPGQDHPAEIGFSCPWLP